MSANSMNAKPDFELLDNGNVVQNYRGKQVVLATYDRNDGFCEFQAASFDKKFREQVTRAITEDTGGESTLNVITEYGIKGRPRDTLKENEPACPEPDPMLGDKTPKVVNWMFKWRPQAAYVRYGVELDKDNKPIIVHGKRSERRYEEDPKTGGVLEVLVETEMEEGYLARRATHRTFTEKEVVGGQQKAPSIEEI